jgi:hypothetical protein
VVIEAPLPQDLSAFWARVASDQAPALPRSLTPGG